MTPDPEPGAIANEPTGFQRAITARAACGRAWIRASTESFLFNEVCRALVAGGYPAAAVHEPGHGSEAFSIVAGAGAGVAGTIVSPDAKPDGAPSGCTVLDEAVDPGAGEPPATAAARFLIRPAGGRKLLVSVYAPAPPGFDAGELAELRELARDLTYAIEALAQRARSATSTTIPRTSQSSTEAALREQLEMTRSITDSAQDAIILIDDGARISYWNRAAESIFGWSAAEALGADLHELIAPERYSEASRRGLETFFATGGGSAIGAVTSLTAVRKDGAEFPVELSLSRLRLRGRWRAVGIVRDTTEREKAIEELTQAKIAAEAAAEAKSLFLANVSHEIRTPLNAIIGMTDLLLETELDRRQLEFVKIVHVSGSTLLAVINDILDFSKMDAEALELEAIPFSVRTCVEEIGDMLAQRAAEKGIELVILVDHRVPPRVAGDPGRLRQVFTNLLNNAIKFTEQGEVVLQVKLRDSDNEKVRLDFSVEDTGVGIPDDRLTEVFKPFTQADTSTTRQYGGTGLGLSIAKRLIEAMGGSITIDSRVGEGTVFRFDVMLGSAPGSGEGAAGTLGSIDDLHVLVVDDNRTNRRLLEELLGLWGCTTVAVASGTETLDLVFDSEPRPSFDLAILDFSMPGMDGGALARTLREAPETATLPLILLTSMPTFGDGERMREYGFNAYLTKPVKRADLHEAILTVTSTGASAATDVEPAMVTRHTLDEARRARVRILVVEDNIVNRKVASRMLESLGYRCDIADNGLAAVEALARGARYDVVLMDCQMPIMDGFEATRKIRELEGEDRHTTIIATTAGALQGDREQCLAAGMDGYISKPIDRGELARALEQLADPPCGENCGAKADATAAAETPEPADPVAIERLQAISRGDLRFEERILTLYLSEADKRMASIARALGDRDLESVRSDAHAVKGSAGNIGADRVSDLASRLQRAAEDHDGAACSALFDALQAGHATASRWLGLYLDRLRGSDGDGC